MSNELQKLKEGSEYRSVLIVDDDKELAESLSRILKVFFKECVIAYDGEEAYALFSDREEKSTPFTVIITDLELPKIGGLRLIRQIRAVSPHQSILILSGHDEGEYMAEAIRLDVEGYLLKPLAMPKLFEHLEKIFTSPHHSPSSSPIEIDPVTGWKTFHELANRIQTLESPNITLLRMRVTHLNNMITFVGESFANEYIVELSTLMKTLLHHTNGEFYRTANDEFCLVLEGDMTDLAKNISANMVSTVRYFHTTEKGIILNSTLCVGIAYGKEYVLLHSKLALEKVLNVVGGGYSIFTLTDHDENLALIKSRNILRMIFDALHEENIVPFFQPVSNSETFNLLAYESVVQIRKDGNVYGPESFWSLASEMGQMGMITRSMIRRTFELKSSLGHQKPIIISLTGSDLNDESLLNYIRFWERKYKIEPEKIFFQIIEGIKALQTPMALGSVATLQKIGYKIILTDFGMGECNLSTLLSIKPDYVKFHPELIGKNSSNPDFLPIFAKMVDIIHTIGAKAIFPAVSKAEQLLWLRSGGIDYLSGPYIGEIFEVHNDQ